MLMYHTNIDEHLDFLENQQGHCFFLSCDHKDIAAFITSATDEILSGAFDHTMLIVEQPTTHAKNFKLRRILKKFGARVDGKRKHHIHAFVVPSALYEMLLREWNRDNN